MTNAMVLIVSIAVLIVLPGIIAKTAFDRYRTSRSSNRTMYLGMTGFAVLALFAVSIPLLQGDSPGGFALAMTLSTLPAWVLVRSYCDVNRRSL
jgi:hypothetical protein